MYSRSNSGTLTQSFGFSRMATRSTEPEVFTFERIPAQAAAVRSYVPIRPKKRCTRVMYPAKVRMHLPPPEKNRARRWLLVLCLVVLWQIYTEEPCADGPAGDSAGAPYRSAEEEEERRGASSELLPDDGSPTRQVVPRTASPEPREEAEASRSFQQGAGKSYVVALLVYHRLGGDN